MRSTEVTDLRWPRWPNRQCAYSSLAMSWPNHVQILSFASMAPSQVARKHDFVVKVAGGCSSSDVIAPWPDLTRSISFCQKLCKVCPMRYPNSKSRRRVAPPFFRYPRKTSGGVAPTPPVRARVKNFKTLTSKAHNLRNCNLKRAIRPKSGIPECSQSPRS